MKKNIVVLIVFVFLGLIPVSVLATSGACSSHGGVNCSAGANYAGKVQCNDGWVNSSVYFSNTDECKTNLSDICGTPYLYGATNMSMCDQYQSVCNQTNQQLQNALIMGGANNSAQNISTSCPQADSCRQQVASNNTAMQLYNQCLETARQTQATINQEEQEKGDAELNQSNQQSEDSICQSKVGDNSYSKEGKCYCSDGYLFDKNISKCVPEQQIQDASCHAQAGINSYSKNESCYCSDGYSYDIDTKQCGLEKEVLDKSCKEQFGELAEMTIGNTDSCSCPSGYEFNSEKRCEKVSEPAKTTENPAVAPITKSKPKISIKSDVSPTSEIIKEPVKANAIITPPQTENTTAQSSPAPVKKLTWWQKIFSWFK